MHNIVFRVQESLRALLAHEEGQDLIEYGLLVSLIALAAVATTKQVGSEISNMFSNIGTSLS